MRSSEDGLWLMEEIIHFTGIAERPLLLCYSAQTMKCLMELPDANLVAVKLEDSQLLAMLSSIICALHLEMDFKHFYKIVQLAPALCQPMEEDVCHQ